MGVKLGLSHRVRGFESWDWRGLDSEGLRDLDRSQNINWDGQSKQHAIGGACMAKV